MHYRGTIDDSSATGVKGMLFDKSRQPFEFVLGAGTVIQGWEQGLLDMCVGEKRTLIVPPELGYGHQSAGKHIPGGATLKFEVKCVDIIPPNQSGTSPTSNGPTRNIFKELDADGDWLITHPEMVQWYATYMKTTEIPKWIWNKEDKNKDGVISWEEFDGAKGEAPPHIRDL
eukprot:CAMPEP_0185030712 /NCGR_PEP_ID=MMETSP1103-20130426/17742_1 /TAXON_ID=36769 /ORGANISM="Paraphysomonas bandaiensis, Strain Caron Lab Isolate" /LENGTH=171 /DNA_ID=CAMNT_0027565939 /DNA_START=163 /DNA_END=678 /DNA_ORIENTATION=-